jgi:hypothetical protein
MNDEAQFPTVTFVPRVFAILAATVGHQRESRERKKTINRPLSNRNLMFIGHSSSRERVGRLGPPPQKKKTVTIKR